jgi:hypothetical membrane protein
MSSTNLSSSTQQAKQVARIATIAIVGIAYFLIAVVALHFLRPDYDPVSRFVSEYAVGSYGFLMTSAFFGLSLGSLALVIGLYQGVPRSGRSWIGLVLLGIWGVGILIAGIFPTDLRGAPETLSGNIHDRASVLSFFSLITATILLSWRLKHDERWRPFHRSALILALLILATFIGFFLTVDTELVGLSQRIFIVTFLIWLLLTAARLRFVTIGSISK